MSDREPVNKGGRPEYSLTARPKEWSNFAIHRDPIRDVENGYGIINLARVPLLAKPENGAPVETEGLYGECVEVLEQSDRGWTKIKLAHNQEEGWIDTPFESLAQEQFLKVISSPSLFISSRTAVVQGEKQNEQVIFLGSRLPNYREDQGIITFGNAKYKLKEGALFTPDKRGPRADFVNIAYKLLESPFQWGGRTIHGIDCSGLIITCGMFSQLALPHSANKQSQLFTPIPLENTSTGDLLFFGKTGSDLISHVGIMICDTEGRRWMLHASGKVDLVPINSDGVYNLHKDRELKTACRLFDDSTVPEE